MTAGDRVDHDGGSCVAARIAVQLVGAAGPAGALLCGCAGQRSARGRLGGYLVPDPGQAGLHAAILVVAGSFENARNPLVLFFVQLAFNLEWSFLFFGMQMIGWALLDSLVLWCVILLTALAFLRFDRIAAVLMVPYFAWVGYATVLNAAVWRLN
jgi:hypothetical protein